MTTLFEHEKAAIHFNEQTNSIEMIWKMQHDHETYKMLFLKILDYIKEYRATGFLSDIRKEGIVAPISSNWVQTEIMPKAFALGLKKIAVIMDADVFKKFYIKTIEKAAGSDRIQYFDHYEPANEWLRS